MKTTTKITTCALFAALGYLLPKPTTPNHTSTVFLQCGSGKVGHDFLVSIPPRQTVLVHCYGLPL